VDQHIAGLDPGAPGAAAFLIASREHDRCVRLAMSMARNPLPGTPAFTAARNMCKIGLRHTLDRARTARAQSILASSVQYRFRCRLIGRVVTSAGIGMNRIPVPVSEIAGAVGTLSGGERVERERHRGNTP